MKDVATNPSTPLRQTLYRLDLLLAPPPVGLGHKALSHNVSGKTLIHWITKVAQLGNNEADAVEILEDMERIGGLACVRGVGADGDYFHFGAKRIKETGVLNHYLKKGVREAFSHGGMFGSLQGRPSELSDVSSVGNTTFACQMTVAGVSIDEARKLASMDTKQIIKGLNDAWRGLCTDCLKREGHEVVYEKIRSSKWWPMALEMVHQFGEMERNEILELKKSIGENGWKAVLFNVYNLLVWHGKIILGSPDSLASRGKFFDSAKYWLGGIGGIAVSLSEWEHQILRRKWAKEQGIKQDLVLKVKDPRMHFILNCGAQSCPPIVPLNLAHSEKQIKQNTSVFIYKNCILDQEHNTVTLSRLWKWFRIDFTPEAKTTLNLLRWIQSHAPDDKKHELEILCEKLSNGADVKLKFMRYNWADNGDWNAKPEDHLMHVYDLSFKRNE